MMFGLFKTPTRHDPQFGSLVKKWGKWTGILRTRLFPEVDLPVAVKARNEDEFSVYRRHFEQVLANSESIRAQISSEAFRTYQMYKNAEGSSAPYPDIVAEEDIWPLMKPQEWRFESGGGFECKSHVIIDFGWPNPHFLVAYLTNTELYQLEVAG